MLEEFLRRAEDCQRRGRWEEAVRHWEEALRRLPDMPEPRRRQVAGYIREALEEAARSALHHPSPDFKAARRHLEHAARVAGNPDILVPLGWVVHLMGEPAVALRWYERAAAAGDAPRALAYARQLAELQVAVAGASALRRNGPERPFRGRAAQEWTAPGWDAAPLPLKASAPAVGKDPAPQPLETAAWRRLAALAALAAGDAAGALARFPDPGEPVLPGVWALEGALLAALSGDWAACLAYYRRAQRQGQILARDPHPYVFAAAWLCGDEGKGDGVPFPATAIRERAPKQLFVDGAQYRAWRRQFLRWQYRWWLARARAALARRDDAALQESLAAATRLFPKERLSRALQAWLACAYGGARPPDAFLEDGRGPGKDPEPLAFVRLRVWMAERFAAPADVVRQLNRLLEEFPHDAWGLARWKRWMIQLGQEAMAQGRWRQALLQFVSLLLRLPEDEDGWRWCGRLHAELGNASRAADCLAQAERVGGRGRRALRSPAAQGEAGPDAAPGTPVSTSGQQLGAGGQRVSAVGQRVSVGGQRVSAAGQPVPAVGPPVSAGSREDVEYGLLEELLTERGEDEAAAVLPCVFSPKALTKAVWDSVRQGDAYLEFLLNTWVRRADIEASTG